MNISPSFPNLIDLGGGWYRIESGYHYPGHDAIFLCKCDDEVAVFDAGTDVSITRVVAALKQLDIALSAVKFVLISHAHLDHCGGAGALLERLPNAQCYASVGTCKHLQDPRALCAGARQIYTTDYDSLYGEVLPVPAARCTILKEGSTITLGSRTLQIVEVPGHTFDHIAVIDQVADCIFAGDTFGVFLPPEFGLPEILRIPAAPTQFAPDRWKNSIKRLVEFGTKRVFATHYGEISGDLNLKADQLCAELDWFVELARKTRGHAEPEAFIKSEITKRWLDSFALTAADIPEHLYAIELTLCTKGIALWMDQHLDDYSS